MSTSPTTEEVDTDRLKAAIRLMADALYPFAQLAKQRFLDEGGAPSMIDILTNHGECEELELRSYTGTSNRTFILSAEDFRKAAEADAALEAVLSIKAP